MDLFRSKKEQLLVAPDEKHGEGGLTLAGLIPCKSGGCEDKSSPSSNYRRNKFFGRTSRQLLMMESRRRNHTTAYR